MTLESELKLQASLDGELSRWQTRKVSAWVARNPEAQLLLAELKMTKTAMGSGEAEMKLPESREFYWSKIQRAIQSAEQTQPKPALAFLVAWRKLLAPLAGAALVMFLTVYTFRMYDGAEDPKHHLAVVENLSEHTGAYSFRSQSENMFVVWVYDRTEETDAESEPTDDLLEK